MVSDPHILSQTVRGGADQKPMTWKDIVVTFEHKSKS